MTRSSVYTGLAGLLVSVAITAGPCPSPATAADPHDTRAIAQKSDESLRPRVTVVEGGESKLRPEDCLGTLVGPDVNQPDPFPGYGGFVGWNSPVQLKNGDWLVGFSAGYWHASPPTPLRFSPKTIEEYHKMGLPQNIVAPTGGRAMIIRSTDQGKTWSKPVTLIDTPDDDRHPAWLALPDGALVCSLFTYPGGEPADFVRRPELAYRVGIFRSFDLGKTWEKGLIRPPSPFIADESDGPMVLLKDGSILLTLSGVPKQGCPAQAAVFTSRDRGATWKLLSVIKADHDLDEANAVQLTDGQLVLMARPEGDICWSGDHGRTWTPPVTFGMRMYAPSLYVLCDGTVWRPGESDVSIRPGWFWHASQDSKVRSAENLVDLYFKSVGRNSLLLLNVPPNSKGLLSDVDVERLREFRAALDAVFKTNLAAGAKAKASNVRDGDLTYGPGQALDADPDTYWATDDGQAAGWLEVDLGGPVEFNVVMIQEAIALGQRVEAWQLEVWREGAWQVVARGTTIGHKRLERFEPVTAQRARLMIGRAKSCPLVSSLGLYRAARVK
jgi:hypothetical protein